MNAVTQPDKVTGTLSIPQEKASSHLSVLHVHSGNLFGGIERAILTCVENLHFAPSITFEFALCFPGRFSEALAAAGQKVHQLPEVRTRNPISILVARRELKRLLAVNSYDVVICHSPWSHSIFAPVIRRAGIPELFWAHDHFRGTHWLERWARRSKPDFVISNSNYSGQSVSRIFPGVRQDVVHCPVDTDYFRRSSQVRNDIRAELSIPQNAVVILQISRMEPGKGHQLLLETIAELGNTLNLCLWVVGGTQRTEEKAYLAHLQALAGRLNVSGRIRFVGEQKDVSRFIAGADILCQPNASPDSFGLVFVEALSGSLPVLTFGMGGAAEIIDNTCGILVEPGDGNKFAAELRRLIVDADLRHQLASAGPDRAKKLCDPALILPQLEAILLQLSGRQA